MNKLLQVLVWALFCTVYCSGQSKCILNVSICISISLLHYPLMLFTGKLVDCNSSRTGSFCLPGIMTLDTVECELWGWDCISDMEVKKDGEGGGGGWPWSSSGAPSAPTHPNCYRSAFLAVFLFFIIIGVFVGLLIGESVDYSRTHFLLVQWRMNHSFSVAVSLPGAGAALFHGDSGAEGSEVWSCSARCELWVQHGAVRRFKI